MRGREPLPAPGRNFSTVRQAKTRRGGLAKPRCRAYAVCGARRAAPRQCPALRARGSQRILNQPDAAVLRVRHVKQRAVWRKVQTERAMKAAGYPARARPPCAAHGKRVACRGADDADLVVACVRDSHLSRERTHACGPPEGARVLANSGQSPLPANARAKRGRPASAATPKAQITDFAEVSPGFYYRPQRIMDSVPFCGAPKSR